MATLDWIRKAALREQSVWTRIKARWYLHRLTVIDRQIVASFVGDAGAHLSNILNGGKTDRLEAKAGPIMAKLGEITVGSMKGLEVIEFPVPYRRGEIVMAHGETFWEVLDCKVTDRGPVEHLCRRVPTL